MSAQTVSGPFEENYALYRKHRKLYINFVSRTLSRLRFYLWPRIFPKSKKKKGEGGKEGGEKTEGCGGSFPSAEVWFKSTFQTII